MSGYSVCPQCRGEGVVVVGRDYCCGDKAITEDCGLCAGVGEVRADVAVDYLEREVRS